MVVEGREVGGKEICYDVYFCSDEGGGSRNVKERIF